MLKTHCKHGHPLTPENVYNHSASGHRACKLCRKARYRKWAAAPKTLKRDYSPEVLAAVDAYIKGETAINIEKRTGIKNAALYRGLRFLGLPLQSTLKRQGRQFDANGHKKWCKWCGDDLADARRSFCNKTCLDAYWADLHKSAAAEEARKAKGITNLCRRCGKPAGKNKTYCSQVCRDAAHAGEWSRVIAGARRMNGHVSLKEIAATLGVGRDKIRAALAEANGTRVKR